MQINSHTILYGVFGDPVRHSKSPLMLNRAFAEAGINAAYAAFHIQPGTLKDAINGIRALQFRGVNVTIPHKEEVMSYMDEIDEGARSIGAVNTVVNDGGRLIGYNTDGIGYIRSLKEETGLSLSGKKVLMLGAGGASRGVAYALAKDGASMIWFANRTVERAKDLASYTSAYTESAGIGFDGIEAIKEQVDIVVNNTPVGMHPNINEVPIDTSWFHEGLVVSDIIYTPMETRLLREAKQKGAVTHSGLGMFIYQGAYAFEYWTGKSAPVEAMREAVLNSMA
ncbi:shikimate dehydrogenase [Paenibacillus contaminans]|uniref:Shikimate dehydrogenase (NADP(+)) n=1 Tax=Paenibacillus contaminans TaxID=450362 RepID=A0A329MQJ6_9BACL|nr:shikimate dehydrogenase [Paenibacillus contaminans]RAV21832.1 shikimate dehydrogenase [Paenibacillus contaminans]